MRSTHLQWEQHSFDDCRIDCIKVRLVVPTAAKLLARLRVFAKKSLKVLRTRRLRLVISAIPFGISASSWSMNSRHLLKLLAGRSAAAALRRRTCRTACHATCRWWWRRWWWRRRWWCRRRGDCRRIDSRWCRRRTAWRSTRRNWALMLMPRSSLAPRRHIIILLLQFCCLPPRRRRRLEACNMRWRIRWWMWSKLQTNRLDLQRQLLRTSLWNSLRTDNVLGACCLRNGIAFARFTCIWRTRLFSFRLFSFRLDMPKIINFGLCRTANAYSSWIRCSHQMIELALQLFRLASKTCCKVEHNWRALFGIAGGCVRHRDGRLITGQKWPNKKNLSNKGLRKMHSEHARHASGIPLS